MVVSILEWECWFPSTLPQMQENIPSHTLTGKTGSKERDGSLSPFCQWCLGSGHRGEVCFLGWVMEVHGSTAATADVQEENWVHLQLNASVMLFLALNCVCKVQPYMHFHIKQFFLLKESIRDGFELLFILLPPIRVVTSRHRQRSPLLSIFFPHESESAYNVLVVVENWSVYRINKLLMSWINHHSKTDFQKYPFPLLSEPW